MNAKKKAKLINQLSKRIAEELRETLVCCPDVLVKTNNADVDIVISGKTISYDITSLIIKKSEMEAFLADEIAQFIEMEFEY